MKHVVIGVDCAVQAADVGLARVRGEPAAWHLEAVVRASTMRLPEQIVAEWIHDQREPVLLALDAPLGWPVAMGSVLANHRAGEGIPIESNELFRRSTDRFVKKTFGKTPPDVGADRIARTAHWAVNFLESLRERLGVSIPLAWEVPLSSSISAIEVYPAATLLAHGAELSAYKSAGGERERTILYEKLRQRFTCEDECVSAVQSPHLIDAAICALAGTDFLEKSAVAPDDRELAEHEGWIWAKARTLPV